MEGKNRGVVGGVLPAGGLEPTKDAINVMNTANERIVRTHCGGRVLKLKEIMASSAYTTKILIVWNEKRTDKTESWKPDCCVYCALVISLLIWLYTPAVWHAPCYFVSNLYSLVLSVLISCVMSVSDMPHLSFVVMVDSLYRNSNRKFEIYEILQRQHKRSCGIILFT